MALTNQVRLIGYCAEAPVKITTQASRFIVKIAVYTTHWWRNAEGKLEEQSEGHQCLFFGHNAEKAMRFLQKGNHIHLDGTIHYEKPKGTSSFKGVYTKIIVQEFTISDRIALSKEMFKELFPNEEPNRVELHLRDRYERENFDRETARIENQRGKHYE